MKKEKIWLLFLGRLEKEKGFDLILDAMRQDQASESTFELYIFGSGSLEKELLDLQKEKKNIHFFGRKPLSEVERYLGNINYCLMPSMCLETFGLSAVNVLGRGIPVIGFKKWGLTPFIRDEYNISACEGKTPLQKLKNQLEKLKNEQRNQNSEFFTQLSSECKHIAQKYSKERRFEQFQSMIFDFKCKKIVLVSDFINPIGGIETYLHEARNVLIQQGYQVRLFGSECPSGFWGKIKKYTGLGLSLFNLWEALRLRNFIKKEKPDLIWFHSMIRREGRLPISFSSSSNAKKRMMYHDLWYFHPYPSQAQEENEVKNLTLSSFLSMSKTKNPLKLLLVCGKWVSLKLLSSQLRKSIDKHLVPSAFMTPMVKRTIQVPTDNIQTFAHFVQK